ncbi:MAG: hypothetical protein ACJ8ER_05555 [Allosphingosinicella sp.]
MALRNIALAASVLAAGCSAQPAARADHRSTADANQAAPATAPATAPAGPVQTRYDRTMSGQPLTRPPTPFQLMVTKASYPSGYVIACHKHLYPRYVLLQSGNLSVFNFVTRTWYNFSPGDVLVESIDQFHEGHVTSPGPVNLVAFEQVPPGAANSVPGAPPPNSPCRPPPPPRK